MRNLKIKEFILEKETAQSLRILTVNGESVYVPKTCAEIKPLALAPVPKAKKHIPITNVFLNDNMVFTGNEKQVLSFMKLKRKEIEKAVETGVLEFDRHEIKNKFTFETL